MLVFAGNCPDPQSGRAALRNPLLSVAFLLVLHVPAAAAEGEGSGKGLVERYDRLLAETFPDPGDCARVPDPERLAPLVETIRGLVEMPVDDPAVLQDFPFVASYEILFRLQVLAVGREQERLEEWKEALRALDARAYRVNRFWDRPAAQWVIRKARTLPAQPTPRMLEGYIEREEGKVYVDADGVRCGDSRKGCDKVRYVLIRCLVPGVDDPRTARDRLHAFPPVEANRRVTHYWEMPLDPETLLIRRTYRMKPLPGYEGIMENYHQLVFRDRQRIVILEVNTRVGQFILQTDNAAAYIRSPPYGVTVALIFTGSYKMEGFFRMLAGDKPMTEPLEVLSILRQYMTAPEKGTEHAVRVGTEDFREHQQP